MTSSGNQRPGPAWASAPWIRGLAVLAAGETLARALSFVGIWILTQRLGPEAYAPVAVVLAVMMFATLVVEMGFPLFGVRAVARDPSTAALLLPRALGVQVSVASVLVLAAVLVSASGAVAPELAALLPGYAVSLLLLPWLAPWLFQGLGTMQWVAVPAVVRQLLFLVGAMLAVDQATDVVLLPWVEIAAVGGSALVAQAAVRRMGFLTRIDFRGSLDPTMLREAVPMGASQLLWVLRMYLATIVLWTMVPKESVSHYDVAHRVMMVMQALLTVYFANLYPSIVRTVRGTTAAIRRFLWQSSLLAGGGSLAAALAVALAAAPLLQALFPRGGYANAETIACLAVLAFVVPVLAIRGHARLTLLALDHGRAELACSIAGTIALGILVVFWTPTRGALGAARALLTAEIFGTVLTLGALGYVLTSRRAPLPPPMAAPTSVGS